MMVQDHSSPKPSKPHFLKHKAVHYSETKNLDFSTWVSENSVKLFVISLLTLSVAALFYFRTSSVPNSLLCFQNTHQNQPEKTKLPKLDLGSVQPILDKSSPFSSFHSEQWIVVSVSDYPSSSLQSLVRLKGWQVLAIGNSRTPKDWNLKGAIYLSLEQQASLGFRVVDFLPYDSYVRKSVGYLFAIQHGAKRIYDADDRGEVIGGDLGKHFDLELDGATAKQQRILQYSLEIENRTVVNPYIHFGQRSVWPRGLPLESVGFVNHEEFYTEVSGGRQYIQQGISNGLPDVDSVFYSTRKVGSEALDVTFDEHAPKVALPQSLMVPINSFNTLFHYNAFWSLMLPVSVSTMASDVLRGYWAQRLLWDIGGFVAVYPPTVHRDDKVEAYHFSEEKDLHVNVGRLIRFLVSWRSEKQRLFEKILELSHSMSLEGFWSENDVKFTAAWLQDLAAVGYQQPRLMAVQSDLQKTTVKRGDRKEFVPRKLPSVHLGVEESGTVNYEIGNLIRWRRNFGNVVLILFVAGPVQQTALEWRLLYGRIFKTVVILSTQADADLAVEQGQLDHVYKYLPRIFERFNSTEGFLFLQDNTILNYWNLLQGDRSKLWIANKVPTSRNMISGKDSSWFLKQAELVKKVVSTMPVHLQVNYKESGPTDQSIALCGSEVFYVPRRFVQDFVDLVDLVGDLDIHHKIALPMFFMAMDLPQNFDNLLNKMVYKRGASSTNSLKLYSAQVPAVHPLVVSTESEFIKLIRLMAAGDPLLMELV
ncbi:probable glycosyltransferase STELLO1 [Lycium ferocissimum]|uniref:probable glycosyltransferase STELLO1 n=1 Tax=Lycium ferocissimum TaxID=112874 RepID=UPI002815103D|nr:probable glycosyltransferase STELLO1 [Lycium ferocissimum]